MNRNRSRIVIIIAIVLIVLLAIGATFAVLYMTTDLFKSEKTLFYKYMAQNEKIGQVLDYSKLNEYNQKSESLPHTYEGSITFTESSSDTSTAIDNSQVNNLKLEIGGKSDPVKQNRSTDFKIKYGDSELFHLSAIKNEDLYGILSEEIITKYIAVKNENLKEFAAKIGINNTDVVPDKIKLDQYYNLFSITDEQKNDILEEYKSIFEENIPNENYQKQEEVPLLINNNNISTTTYSVTLTESDVYVIYKRFLEVSKNSQVITSLLQEKAKELGYNDTQISNLMQEYQKQIQENIDNIDIGSKDDEKEAVKIVLYTANKQLLKTELILNQNITTGIVFEDNGTQTKLIIISNEKTSTNQTSIEIIKNDTDEKFDFTITIDSIRNSEESKFVCKYEKNGSTTSNTIKDAMSFGINNGTTTYRVDYSNTEDYSANIDVQKLDSSNSVTLNSYPAEDIQNLLTAITTRIEQVIQEKKQLLQLSGVVLPGMNQGENLTTEELAAFNSQFMAYSGSDVAGANVKTLLTQIINSNTLYDNKKVAVNFRDYTDANDTQTLTDIESLINLATRYTVSLEYEQDGFINKIIIKENV